MNIPERIAALRGEMKKEGIDLYLIPSTDYHQSEYVGEYFRERQFISGFTGSAGTVAVTSARAGLWTDGRYFLQAEQQLEGSGIELFRMGEPGVDTLEAFAEKTLPDGGVIGFDGRTIGITDGRNWERIAGKKNGHVRYQCSLIDRIWSDRPRLPDAKAFLLDEKYSGESTAQKLSRVREKMREYHADIHLLSSLDDIAWLLNIRGGDIAYCPLVLAYLILNQDSAVLFTDADKFGSEIRELFEKNRISLRPYGEIGEALNALSGGQRILLDPERVNYTLLQSIPENVEIVERENPEVLMKSTKNDVEAANIRNAHLKDAAAHIRFMRWLKENIGKTEITEISASDRLEQFRAEQKGYLGPSFAPISAYAEHGAIVHYSADQKSNAVLRPGKMLLTDTGGHYMEGSTDITRTVALGEIPMREKEDFTLVLRAMLRLMNTVFLYGCTGASLDCIAREVFWEKRVNFNHGTGHGVGYLMNIHEAPINFRWKEGKFPAAVLEKNMVITDEPGIYIAGSHGIRTENELLVCEDETNEYGRFMHFEPLTFVPVDLDAVLPEQMAETEREMLNRYHAQVYEKISPLLTEEECAWLKEYTRPV